MKKIRMKNIIKEDKNSPAEQGLKKLADKDWKYVWDTAAGYGALEYKTSELSIFAPYDAVKDEEHFFAGSKPKDKFSIQVGDTMGVINKVFWYPSISTALRDVKNLKIKYAKVAEKWWNE